MAVDHMADLEVAKLQSAGISARRIPPMNLGALVPANIRIRILVPRTQQDEARAILDAEKGPRPRSQAPSDEKTDTAGGRIRTVFKWIVVGGLAIYLIAQLFWILTSQTR